MNLAEMFSTTGGILFYGGLIGAGVSVLLSIIFAISFAGSKKRLEKKISREYSEK